MPGPFADFTDARRWTRDGTTQLISETAGLGEAALGAPSALPGWTRKHLVAHVAANAEALGNLVHWAATGEPTPMYSSQGERAAGIERGALLPADELNAWLQRSAQALDDAMTALSDDQWQAPVKTAQGRTVPATEVPWLRAREVYVHAVDLATGLSFAELPADFRAALCDDVVAKRASAQAPGPTLVLEAVDAGRQWDLPGDGDAVTLSGPLAEVTAYLTGRPHKLTTADGDAAPDLGPWL
jgi:maleylpyruvate isomerase